MMRSLNFQLLFSLIGIILCVEVISSLAILHEVNELMEVLMNSSLTDELHQQEITREFEEIMIELVVSTIFAVVATSILIYLTVQKLMRPLNLLSQELALRSSSNLEAINIPAKTKEVGTIIHATNKLFERITAGLEDERNFTEDIAHELRTPLAGLRINLELLNKNQYNEKIDYLMKRLDQMGQSIDQLLHLSRASHKLQKGEAISFDLIAEVIQPIKLEIEELGFPHEIEWNHPAKLTFRGDSNLMFVLFRNILENIEKYAADSLKTIVDIEASTEQILIRFTDNGPGVSQDKIDIMTERYSRLDQSKKGSGLGLNIVKRIVHAHRGKILIKNRSDAEGLIVEVLIPMFGSTLR